MNHFIAMNPQRGGNKGSASCLPLAEYDKLIAQPWLHDMVEQIRGGNDKLKGLMPFRCGTTADSSRIIARRRMLTLRVFSSRPPSTSTIRNWWVSPSKWQGS